MQYNRYITIKTFPRIHLTLIGMNENDYRINGGIGFSINSPTLNLKYFLSNSIEIYDKRDSKFSLEESEKLYTLLKNIKNDNNLKNGISCTIEGEVIPHYGFGSSTSIYLSCIEAIFLLNRLVRQPIICTSDFQN